MYIWKTFAFICIEIVSSLNFGLFFNQSSTSSNDDLISKTSSIIQILWQSQFAVVDIVDAIEDQKNPESIDFIGNLLQQQSGFAIYQLDGKTQRESSWLKKKKIVVVLLDSFKAFTSFNEKLVPSVFDFRGYFLLILTGSGSDELTKIFEVFWAKRIINVSAIFLKNHKVKIKTFLPFVKGKCSDTTPQSLEVPVFSVNMGHDLKLIFPDKTRNLHGCVVRLVTLNICPLVCATKVDRKIFTVGYDFRIMQLIGSRLNFNQSDRIFEPTGDRGTMLPNGTVTGALKMLLNNETDIAFGAFGNYGLRTKLTSILDYSLTYHIVPIVFAIPPGELLTPFEKLLLPFDSMVWISLLVTLCTGILVIVFLNWTTVGKKVRKFFHEDGTGNPIMNMLVAILGLGQTTLPTETFPRITLATFLIFCFVLRNVYQGLLFDFMQSDGRHKEIQTIQELVDEKNFTILMHEAALEVLDNFPKILNKQVVHLFDVQFKINYHFFPKPQNNSIAERLHLHQTFGRRCQISLLDYAG